MIFRSASRISQGKDAIECPEALATAVIYWTAEERRPRLSQLNDTFLQLGYDRVSRCVPCPLRWNHSV